MEQANNIINRLESKLDKLDERLDKIDKAVLLLTQAQQKIDKLEQKIEKVEIEVRDLKEHNTKSQTIIKFILWVAGAVVGVLQTLKLIGFFDK